MAESQIPTYSEATNAIQVPYESGTALFYIANGSTLTVVYNTLIHTIASQVDDYSAMYANNGTNEYFILYILANGSITRYELFLFDTGYNMVHDLNVASNATTFDFYQVTSTKHSISYIDDQDSVHYISFDNALGVEYFWDKEDTQLTSQVQFDTGEVLGLYMVDDTDNVNTLEYEFQQGFISVTPATNNVLEFPAFISTDMAIIDTDIATIMVNDVTVNHTFSNDVFTIELTSSVAKYGKNSVEITDGTYTYSGLIEITNPADLLPTTRPYRRMSNKIDSSRSKNSLCNGKRGPGVCVRIR